MHIRADLESPLVKFKFHWCRRDPTLFNQSLCSPLTLAFISIPIGQVGDYLFVIWIITLQRQQPSGATAVSRTRGRFQRFIFYVSQALNHRRKLLPFKEPALLRAVTLCANTPEKIALPCSHAPWLSSFLSHALIIYLLFAFPLCLRPFFISFPCSFQ